MPPMFGCVQISLPVAASSATMALALPCTYMTLSMTMGLKITLPVTGYVHATCNCDTLVLLIWLSAEYWEECDPPPYAVHWV